MSRLHLRRLIGSLVCGGFVGLMLTASAAWGVPPGSSDRAARVPLPWKLNPYPSTYRPLPRQDTLIVNATILDGAGHRFDKASVLLRDGKVVEIGTKTPAA